MRHIQLCWPARLRVSYQKKITFVRRLYPVTSAVRLVVAGLVHEERLASGVLHKDGGSTLLQNVS